MPVAVFPIVNDVPVPTRHGNRGPHSRYPFLRMVVGDSFVVPFAGDHVEGRKVTQRRITSTISDLYRRGKWPRDSFTTAVDHDAKGVRVWRVK